VESTLNVFEAAHPWGPWKQILAENVNNKDNACLAWTMLMQQHMSADGKKMWTTVSGQPGGSYNPYNDSNEYCLQFKPLYLTTEPVSMYEAEEAELKGAEVQRGGGRGGYTGKGYVTGFDTPGAQCAFTVDVDTTGAYIVKIRYNTAYTSPPYENYSQLSCYINGIFLEQMKLGKTRQAFAVWAEYTMFVWLEKGTNTITIQRDEEDSDPGEFCLDHLKLALFSTSPNSIPG